MTPAQARPPPIEPGEGRRKRGDKRCEKWEKQSGGAAGEGHEGTRRRFQACGVRSLAARAASWALVHRQRLRCCGDYKESLAGPDAPPSLAAATIQVPVAGEASQSCSED